MNIQKDDVAYVHIEKKIHRYSTGEPGFHIEFELHELHS